MRKKKKVEIWLASLTPDPRILDLEIFEIYVFCASARTRTPRSLIFFVCFLSSVLATCSGGLLGTFSLANRPLGNYVSCRFQLFWLLSWCVNVCVMCCLLTPL